METQPAPIRPRHLLGLSKESDKQKQHEIRVDARLELEVPREIFRGDCALALLELQRGMERVVDLFHERDQRPDVAIAQSGAGIVPLELFDEPPRIINPDVELIVGMAQEGAGEFTEFPGGRARQPRQLRATALIDQTIFQVDSNLRISPLKELLDLAEERLVHRKSDGVISSSRLSSESERRFKASRTSRKCPARPS